MRAERRAPGRSPQGRCATCRHFQAGAEAIEAAFPGLGTMSSGWASVRAGDGLCALRGLYLPGSDGCAEHSHGAAGFSLRQA